VDFHDGQLLGNVDAIRICPADPNGQARMSNFATSYQLNEYTSVDLVDPFGGLIETFRNMNRLRKPGQTISSSPSPTRLAQAFSPTTIMPERPNGWSVLLTDIAPDRHHTGHSTSDHTSGGENYLYADGHVAAIKAAI